MKTKKLTLLILLFTVSCSMAVFFTGCDKDDDPKNTVTPVWKYATGEDPYQSKPFITGDKVIVCTLGADNEPASKPGTHCINKNTGEQIWKINDTATVMVSSPVVYNNLILEGGLNPHARRLSDGELEWRFIDDMIKVSIYSSPLVVGDAAYFASPFHFVRLNAGTGDFSWELIGFYNNLRAVCPVYKNDRVYYADAALYNVTSFFAADGQIDWTAPFSAAFANKPLVTDIEFYVGLQDAGMDVNTLQCLNLSDRTQKWGVKLGSIMSDLALADGKIYAIGMSTIHCRSVADGSSVWSHEIVAGAVSEPLVTGNKLFVGYGKGLICLDASTGDLIWDYKTSATSGHGFSSPTLDGDRIYVSCSDGNVYCFNVN